MANEGNPGTDGTNEGTTPGTGQGDGQPGAGGAPGGGESGAPGAGAGTAGTGIDRSKLDPALQKLSEEQLNTMFTVLLDQASSRGEPAAPTAPTVPERPAPPTDEELKEYLDPNSEKYSPNAAFKKVIDANYSPLINDIAANAMEGLKTNLRTNLPDFKDYESDIDKALSSVAPTAVTQGVLLDTYLRVKGLKATQEMLKKGTKPPTTEPPSPRRAADEGVQDLSAEEVAIAHRVFRNHADPVAAYKAAASKTRTVKVPGEK